jgi:MHS family proline/betaine transporter-like MFS transporter
MSTTETVKPGSGRRAIAAASAGNVFEWYDFTIYAFLAIYISKSFFAEGDDTARLINTFLTYGLGFLVRPLGAVLLGIYGDRVGRKSVLTLTIALMAVGTGIIAVAPTYMAIGLGAPLLLVCGRLLQGFSAGGEFGGAAALLIEHAPPHRRGEYGSWLQATMAGSNILGALVIFTLTQVFTTGEIEAYAWRIPFIFGLLIVPIGIWIRQTLDETPEFKAEKARQALAPSRPLVTLLKQHPLLLLKGWGLCILLTVSSYALVIFMPTYVQRTFGYTPQDAFGASLIGNVLMFCVCIAAGIASDRVGRRAVLAFGAIWLVILVLPMIWLIQTQHSFMTLAFAQCVLCIGVGAFVGVAPPSVAELFPTSVRSTGVSLSYNLAVTIFSGFAPAVLTFLTARGFLFAPGWYVIIAAALATPALLSLKGGKPVPDPTGAEVIPSNA